MSLLLFADFTKSLKDISASNTKASCALVYWTTDLFMPKLLEHLRLAGIEITEDKRFSWHSLEALLHEPSNAPYTIYLLPQAAWEDANALPIHAPSTSKLFIFPTQTNPLTIDLSTLPHLDLTGYDNYYLWVLEVLKRLLPEPLLEKHITYFSMRVAHLSNAIDSMQSSETKSPHKQMQSPPLLATFASKRVYAFLLALCLGLGGLTFYYYFRRPTELPVRSELFIPAESVLLKRPGLIAPIDQYFKSTSTHIQTLAITGVSGAGKTTLAREYARTQKIAVIWEINAQTKETFLISFKNLAYALAKTEGERNLVRGFEAIKDNEEQTKTLFAFVAEKLKTAANWLLIYDNVDYSNKVMQCFPYDTKGDTKGMPGGKIIVTTRDSNIHLNNRIEQTICLPELSEHEKYDLFTKIMAIDAPQSLTAAEKERAKEFVKHLPPFPLDVSAAAYYIKVTNTSYTNYLEHINQPTDDFNEVQEKILGSTGDYTKSRYQIITMPLKQLLEENQGFEKLLLLISLLDASSIPRDLLEGLTDDVTLDKLIISLRQYSLISSHNHPAIPNYPTYSLHRSTQKIWLAYTLRG